jgi:adenylate kinase
VVDRALSLLKAAGVEARTVIFGTVMFEEARRRLGVKHRDEMRHLPVDVQRELQVHAAQAIAEMKDGFLFIDTHLFISTPEGYWPGLPMAVLTALKPTHLILVVAEPHEILARRVKDKSRVRETPGEDQIREELLLAKTLLGVCSVISGAPLLVVENREGRVEEAARRIVDALGVV